MSNGTDSRVIAARPAISINGQENGTLAAGLLSLLIAETTDGLYRCEALFGNWGEIDNTIGFLYFDRRLLDFGKTVQITVGASSTASTLFDGRITGLEAHFPDGQAPTLNVLAEDRLQDLRMTRRTRTFENVSDADVINQIAGEHGLRTSVDVSGPTYHVLAQVNQSDLAFLRERARAIDAEIWVTDRTLHAQAHAKRNGGTLRMIHGRELREFTVLADLAIQRTSVTVNGWDVAGKERLQHEATDTILSGELNGDQSGARILSSAFGTRKEAFAHTVPLTSQEAQFEAEAYFKRQARRFLTGRGVAETNAQLRVGSYVDLQGLGPLFSGKYYVSEVAHVFDGRRGLRTEFMVERPGLGRV